jgi:hypothetical protein
MPALEKWPVQIVSHGESSYGIAYVAPGKSFRVSVGRYDLGSLPLVSMNLTPQIPRETESPRHCWMELRSHGRRPHSAVIAGRLDTGSGHSLGEIQECFSESHTSR